jgi:putative PEP-CTERM system TPR-repeat lipoprotein
MVSVAICLLAAGFIGCSRSPKEKSAKFIDAGKRLLQKGDPARAVLQFRNAVQATPRNAEAYYQLGVAYLALGNAAKAVVNFRNAVEINPKHPAAQLRLAQLMASVDDRQAWQDAERRLQTLLEDAPENADALQALGLTEMKLGNTEDAIPHLERALALAPQDLTSTVVLAQARMEKKDYKGVEQVLQKASADSPKSADAATLLGRFYLAMSEPLKAEQQFRRAVILDPKSGAALLNIAMLQMQTGHRQEAEQIFKRLSGFPEKTFQPMYGLFLYQEGRSDDAIREFERLAKVDAEDRLARSRLIAAYQNNNRVADARNLLNRALAANPKDLDALLERGELSLDSGNLSEAEIDLNHVLHLKPDSTEAHYAAARLYKARGNRLMHRQELSEVLRLNPFLLTVRVELAKVLIADNAAKTAVAVLDESPESQRNSVPIIEQRNWALLGTGNAEEARKGVDRGLAISRSLEFLLQDAALKISQQRYPNARQSLQEAMKLAPQDIRSLRLLVSSYSAQKTPGAAIKEVQAHASNNPKLPEVQYFLGNLLLEAGDKASATQAFTTARALNPQYTPAELELARINLREANWTDARHQLTDILTVSGENPQARLWLGMMEESVGNHDAAILAFRKVTEIQPNNAIAWNNLAYLLAEHQKPDEALQCAQKAQELAPSNPDIQDTLGWALYHKGMYDNAITQLQDAVSKGGGVRQQYHLAMACLKAGKADRGRAILEQALRKDPKPAEAKLAQDLFKAAALAPKADTPAQRPLQ